MSDTTPYQVPKEPGRWRALTLALIVHAALLAFLYVGIRWQNETPVAVEAEVWSTQAKEAAPKPKPEPQAETKPEPVPEPKPLVKEPPKVVQPKPDIALEQEKKRLADLKERERLEKVSADIKARKQAEADAAKKVAAAKWKQTVEAKETERVRQEQIAINRKLAGSGGSGTESKTQSPGKADPDYQRRVAAKILSNIRYIAPTDLAGNPPVEYLVQLLPDGSVASIRKIKPSGVPGFDEAVQRAIENSQPYPKNASGVVPPSFIGFHQPKDK
jgi:colicin import membrane protein